MSLEVRFARFEDIPSIMKFIDIYWRKNHILSIDRKLFDWQYVNNNKVSIVLGINEEGIQGMLGYVPYGNGDDKDIVLALWKANNTEPFLGIKLLVFLQKNENYRTMFCNGINMATTKQIYEAMGLQTGCLKQWYRLNKKDHYKFGRINNDKVPLVKKDLDLVRIKSVEQMDRLFDFSKEDKKSVPYKNREYVIKRYFEHPSYCYEVFGVSNKENIDGLLVLRIQEYGEAKIFRFVDFIGDYELISRITYALDELMSVENIEYVDMYETGLDETMLMNGGWLPVADSGNIIPNYFAPYEERNIDIYYCSGDPNIVIFRGDGDQDRPS